MLTQCNATILINILTIIKMCSSPVNFNIFIAHLVHVVESGFVALHSRDTNLF